MPGNQKATSEALNAVFGAQAHPLREICGGWIASSQPFRAFFEAHATKIRRKVREAGDTERLRDVGLELYVAFHLLADRRVTLAYEKYLAEKTRGPDFTATFKGHLVFNVEVRRLRALANPSKLADVIAEKARQLPPSVPNVLLVGVDSSGAPTSIDPAAGLAELRLLAEGKRDDVFVARGFRDARDFLHAFGRLSGLLLVAGWDDPTGGQVALALNPTARRPLPADVQKLLRW